MENLFGRLLTQQELRLTCTHLSKNIIRLPGMSISGKNVHCNRCGTNSSRREVSLEIPAYFCPVCIQLGRVRSDESLFHLPQQAFPKQQSLQWNGVLTSYQAEISNQLVVAVEQKQQILVHAVTGAGKTEMIYAAISTCIATGGAVCIATPRTDVARELYQRLSLDFTLPISLLHADSKPYFRTALVIATTHQLLRFKEAFDLLIIDEVDAFPFTDNAALQYASQQAQKKRATVIYLTATSTDKLAKQVKTGQLIYTTLSRRFHGHPLVVPKPIFNTNERKVIKYIKKQRKTNYPLLIFSPVIAYGKSFSKRLTTLLPDERIAFVSAESDNRSELISKFRHQELTILITTTILERGVTFPKVDVFVLNSHHRLFTASSLIQIAGRAGRSSERPTGLVYFFHNGLTKALTQAISDIQQMNDRGNFL